MSLKKEFESYNVQRLRNLITGKANEKSHQSVGYEKKEEFYKEGDIWEEDGRKWTIKNNIKQNITKLDKAKALHKVPLFCPNYSKLMKKRFDGDYFRIHSMCFDCVIDFESNLKALGLYETYEKNIINSDIDGFIEGYKMWINDKLNESNNSFVTEFGDVESWVGGVNKEAVMESLNKTIENLKKFKK